MIFLVNVIIIEIFRDKYMNIFITGNVGSGKSTFLSFLKKHVNHENYEFVDLDVIAKQIIKDFNIVLPAEILGKGRNAFFEHPEIIYALENQILPHIPECLPVTSKTLIIEASTLIECPTLLTSEDIVIHVSSDNSIQQTLSRDNLENRAYLISRVQISKFVKHLISDIEVINNGTLIELENQAQVIAENLNFQKTEPFFNTIEKLKEIWNCQFPTLNWFDSIIKNYLKFNRTNYREIYLLSKLNKFESYKNDLSPLWTNAILLAIWFHAYEIENNNFTEKSVVGLWELAKKDNQIMNLIYGSRSYLSLASDLILALKNGQPLSNNLSYGEPEKAFNLFINIILK